MILVNHTIVYELQKSWTCSASKTDKSPLNHGYTFTDFLFLAGKGGNW